jgi:hypothetical protein
MSIANKPAQPKPRIDAYICPDLHATITILLENQNGRPPANIKCTQCDQQARSQGFYVNQNFSPIFEWYKPTEEEVKELANKIKEKPEYNRFCDLINKGMLVSRLYVKPEKNESND